MSVWIAKVGADRRSWSLQGTRFLGQQCHHVVLDPRDPDTAWVFPMDGSGD